MEEGLGVGQNRLDYEAWLHHSLAGKHWASPSMSLNLSLLFCKMGIITSNSLEKPNKVICINKICKT